MSAADAPTPSAPTSDVSFVGKRVGKYEIVRVIARGGMGTVYEAVNTHIGKRVAMKFVDAELSRNKDSVARFQREAEAASAVESGHIVTIFDSGTTDDGLPFLVMELCRGEDLGHRLRKVGRLDLEAALDITAQILRGLCRAHEAGIVHRDLKPDNVFLTEQDDGSTFVKILDFGISKMRRGTGAIDKTITKQGTVLGTPHYMSPEQAQALPDVDERTDLWSLGAILYEALTGKPPHDGHSYEQVIVHICTQDTLDVRMHNPGVPEKLAAFLAKALKRDRNGRFQNAREMLEALGEASEGLLSPRALRVSSGRGATSTPLPSSSTPNAQDDRNPAIATAPTVDVSTGGPSRVGWSTSSGASGNADRRRIALGAVAMAALVTLGIVFVPRQTTPTTVITPTAPDVDQRLVAPPVAPEPPEVAPSGTNLAEQPPEPAVSAKEPAPPATERKPEPSKPPPSSKSTPVGRDKPLASAAPIASAKPTATTKEPAPPATAEPKPTATTPRVAPQLKLKEE
ncbi:MAG: serine/threonine protein kinase [Polyangiaceae bacterium]|nr:serine/threonine protein kinase [Polyangiaceae bacterium]